MTNAPTRPARPRIVPTPAPDPLAESKAFWAEERRAARTFDYDDALSTLHVLAALFELGSDYLHVSKGVELPAAYTGTMLDHAASLAFRVERYFNTLPRPADDVA